MELKFTPGSKPKQPRKTYKEYEQKRKRVFLDKWTSDFTWVRYDKSSGLMFCLECEAWCSKNVDSKLKDCSFVKGCNNFKREALVQHGESRSHTRAHQVSTAKPPAESQAAQCLKSLHKAQYDTLVMKFRTAHAIAKFHLSYRTYNMICSLDEVKGLPIGTNYRNDHAVASFTDAIAAVARKESLNI